MYIFTGGGYGGWNGRGGISNGASTIGISKPQPVEALEQQFPVLFESYGLPDGSAGAGCWRGGLGVSYRVRLLGGGAKASFMMDHGRTGPFGMLGGAPSALNDIRVSLGGTLNRSALDNGKRSSPPKRRPLRRLRRSYCTAVTGAT